MIELKKNFKKFGEDFIQIYKDEKVVIYKRENPLYGNTSFELFKYKTGKDCPLSKNYDPNEIKEMYPSSEQFGLWAWWADNEETLVSLLKEKFLFDDETINEILKSL